MDYHLVYLVGYLANPGLYSAGTTSNLFFRFLGKTWGSRYIISVAGVALGNLYRNNADHSGRQINFKLY